MKLSTAAPESGFKSSSSLALRGDDMPSTLSSERVGNNGRDTRSPVWVTETLPGKAATGGVERYVEKRTNIFVDSVTGARYGASARH